MGAGSSLGKMDPVAFGDALLVNVEGEKVGPANEHYTKLYEVNISQSDGQTYSIYPADISEYSKGGTLEIIVPIINGPFYGMVHRAGTIAGLAVDEEMRVIREDQTVIENLYAAGELIYGNWFNGNYPMSGTGLGGCVSSERIAAHTILADH